MIVFPRSVALGWQVLLIITHLSTIRIADSPMLPKGTNIHKADVAHKELQDLNIPITKALSLFQMSSKVYASWTCMLYSAVPAGVAIYLWMGKRFHGRHICHASISYSVTNDTDRVEETRKDLKKRKFRH